LLSLPHLGLVAGYHHFRHQRTTATQQILVGHFLESGIGVAVAGAILFYLSRPKVRGTFT